MVLIFLVLVGLRPNSWQLNIEQSYLYDNYLLHKKERRLKALIFIASLFTV